MKQYIVQFGDVYGGCTYSSGTYNSSTTTCGSSTGGGGATAPSGGLTNTGIMVIGFVTVACLIIFVALVVRIWRRPRKQLALQEQAADSSPESEAPAHRN